MEIFLSSASQLINNSGPYHAAFSGAQFVGAKRQGPNLRGTGKKGDEEGGCCVQGVGGGLPDQSTLPPTHHLPSSASSAAAASPPPSSARLDVSRTIYVNKDSPNLGFPYFNFLGGYL